MKRVGYIDRPFFMMVLRIVTYRCITKIVCYTYFYDHF